MTEQETIRWAKNYVDLLAQGIDPVTGLECPEDSTLNQAKVIRCLFYVSGILHGLLETREESTPTRKSHPFWILPEHRSAFPFQNNMGITEFVQQLGCLIQDPWMKKPKTTWFTGWLMEKGFLQEETDSSGKKRRVPTSAGYGIGLSVARRQGRYGEYQAVLYNRDAQQFLLDNLSDILPKK